MIPLKLFCRSRACTRWKQKCSSILLLIHILGLFGKGVGSGSDTSELGADWRPIETRSKCHEMTSCAWDTRQMTITMTMRYEKQLMKTGIGDLECGSGIERALFGF